MPARGARVADRSQTTGGPSGRVELRTVDLVNRPTAEARLSNPDWRKQNVGHEEHRDRHAGEDERDQPAVAKAPRCVTGESTDAHAHGERTDKALVCHAGSRPEEPRFHHARGAQRERYRDTDKCTEKDGA